MEYGIGDTVTYNGTKWKVKDKFSTDNVKGDVLLLHNIVGRSVLVWAADLTNISEAVA